MFLQLFGAQPETPIREAGGDPKKAAPAVKAAYSIKSILLSAAVIGSALIFGGGAMAQNAADGGAAAEAQRLASEGLVRLDQMDRGALLFKSDLAGYYVPAPLLSTKIDVKITGNIARTMLTQRFTNPADVFVEGRYMFPLPDDSAVDTLKMRVGDRLIEGEIKEKQQAKKIYEKAKAEGFVASLLEQEREDVFVTSVANIAPNATVVIQIEYQQALNSRDGAFGLRIPLVVAPRYEPKDRLDLPVFGPNGWEFQNASAVKQQPSTLEQLTELIAPSSKAPGEIVNPVEIDISLEAGFPLGPVKSLYHEVVINSKGVSGADISLDGPAPADRDFYLSWKAEEIYAPHLSLFHEDIGDTRHYLAMLTPPVAAAVERSRRPREVVFVQDVSGSMSFGGQDQSKSSIDQARAGLEMAIKRLHPRDSFNVVIFNDKFQAFYPEPVPVSAENVRDAVERVRGLVADGGTEMLPALKFALRDATPKDGRLRQVIFLTDGAVGNDREMIRLIRRELGESRLFTVGIGSAPNSYFMNTAAVAGRGSKVFIGDLNEVQQRMTELFAKIETPAMIDMKAQIDGFNAADVYPSPLPDLYVGDPLAVAFSVDLTQPTRALPMLKLNGMQGDEEWLTQLSLDRSKERPGVAKLAARRKIDSLTAERMAPDVTEDERKALEAEILKTALTNHLVSDYTSLVAVDKTPVRSADEALVSKTTPLNLPAGWDPEAFGLLSADAPAPEPAAPILQKAALTRLQTASIKRAKAKAARAAAPNSALGWRSMLALGGGLILLGGVLFAVARRKAA